MLFLFKYRFLQTIRQVPAMFWALVFPLILATLFYFTFGSAGLSATGESEWDSIKVCVVEEDTLSDGGKSFSEFLHALDGNALEVISSSSEHDARNKLKKGDITGIYYVKETPSLTVGKNGLNESILTSLLESYNQNASILTDVAFSHPEKLPDALRTVSNYRQMIQEETLGGDSLDPTLQYFFALIAYGCLSGIYLGVQASFDSQANLSALGARRSVTPTHKLALILVDMAVLVIIHFLNIMILTIYISKILNVDFGNHTGSLLLVNLMGCVIGIAVGLSFGCLSKMSLGTKMGLSAALTLLPSFLAGLMFGNMKNIVEQQMPILNRINPAAVLSDAYYCMSVYNDMERFTRCIVTLAAMSILLLTIAFFGIRRERYDSI